MSFIGKVYHTILGALAITGALAIGVVATTPSSKVYSTQEGSYKMTFNFHSKSIHPNVDYASIDNRVHITGTDSNLDGKLDSISKNSTDYVYFKKSFRLLPQTQVPTAQDSSAMQNAYDHLKQMNL